MEHSETIFQSGERPTRESWKSHFEFTLVAVCAVVGFGNFALFPMRVYQNGGGCFLMVYIFCLVFVGLPTIFLELSLGQFTSKGILQCWDFCPLLSGCGFSILIITTPMVIYYNMVIAWTIYFFLTALKTDTPWIKCGNWSGNYCIDKIRIITRQACLKSDAVPLDSGVCQNHFSNETKIISIWNTKRAREHNITITYPAMEYFNFLTFGKNRKSVDTMHTYIVLAVFLAWAVLWMSFVRGINVNIKVASGIIACPFIILVIIAIRGLSLSWSVHGIIYLLMPDNLNIYSVKLWVTAIHQVCFSLSVGYGILTVVASYNRFHSDYLRETLIMACANSMTVACSGVAAFSHLGYLALSIRVDIVSLAGGGALMAFNTIPYALSKLHPPSFWYASFCLMIAVAGMISQRIMMLVIVTSLLDWKPDLRGHKFVTISFLCLFMFVLSLPISTAQGTVILDLLFESSGKIVVLFHVFLENFTIGWVYGADRFLTDIETMLGFTYCGCFVYGRTCRFWWKVCWKFITPSICLCFIIMTIPLMETRQDHPVWARVVEWITVVLCPAVIVIMGVITFKKTPGTLKEKFKTSISPTPAWGPVDKKDLQLMQHYAQDGYLDMRRSRRMISTIDIHRLDSHIHDDLEMSGQQSP